MALGTSGHRVASYKPPLSWGADPVIYKTHCLNEPTEGQLGRWRDLGCRGRIGQIRSLCLSQAGKTLQSSPQSQSGGVGESLGV